MLLAKAQCTSELGDAVDVVLTNFRLFAKLETTVPETSIRAIARKATK